MVVVKPAPVSVATSALVELRWSALVNVTVRPPASPAVTERGEAGELLGLVVIDDWLAAAVTTRACASKTPASAAATTVLVDTVTLLVTTADRLAVWRPRATR